MNIDITKIENTSNENMPKVLDMTKNQNEKPIETARALNLGDDSSILNWINQCN